MKRFSARELAFLTVPIVLIASVGFWATRRQAESGPKLVFRVETPTALQAFDGTEMVLAGEISRDSAGTSYAMANPQFKFELQTPNGSDVWNSAQNSLPDYLSWGARNASSFRFLLNAAPQGEMTYGVSGLAKPVPSTSPLPRWTHPHFLDGEFKVNRAHWKPYNFAQPRVASAKLRSVVVKSVTAQSVSGVAEFAVQGASANGTTDFQADLAETRNCLTRWQFEVGNNAGSPVRSLNFTAKPPIVPLGTKQRIIQITGRVSADDHWPLAFEIEPFDFGKVKVGQQLKFKQWPAPLPPGVNIK